MKQVLVLLLFSFFLLGNTDANHNQKIGSLKPTFYWVAEEKTEVAKRTHKLFDTQGELVYTVTDKFYKALTMEGTGKLLDGRVINFAARVGGVIRWRVCPPEAPYGYGKDNNILVPFRSAAVDPTVVPLGSKLFIPKAVGVRLPDGTKHDGYFYAVDVGAAIKEKRIDLFTSFGDQSAVFEKQGVTNMTPLDVYLVN